LSRIMAIVYMALCAAFNVQAAESLHTNAGEVQSLSVPAPALGQTVLVQIFLPAGYTQDADHRYPTLYINDGQDSASVGLADSLQQLAARGESRAIIAIAIAMLPDRMATYGFADRTRSLPAQTRFGPVGNQAHSYSEWLVHTLVPLIDNRFRTQTQAAQRGILGWSLGAASAFSLAWNYPEVFGHVGAFSPSFWLSAETGKPQTALVRTLMANAPVPACFKMDLAVGSAEETDDRDGDGVIDVQDDAQDVLATLQQNGSADPTCQSRLRIIEGGQHNQATWKQMLPEFLRWAYPKQPEFTPSALENAHAD
jgi:enterochelin esterase-like enzyme